MTDINYTKLFKPELTPKEMLEAGVFGGYYFKNDISEYPKTWFKKAKISDDGFNVNLNFFNVKSGLTMDHWISKGWIFSEDPLGWFQWYSRYSMGRRLPEIDKVQIMRWKAFGPRHKGAILKNCLKNDYSCRPRQRQGLLQWAYNPFF
tara:strand:+ start:387 stop:830 length:444 start_codon:yes stop_codon:yes gene_type:complete